MARMSLAFPVPSIIRLFNLSRSYTASRRLLRSLRNPLFLKKNVTASSLSLIRLVSCKGKRRLDFNSLAPMGVQVWSMTESRDPCLLPPIMVWVSSRLRLEESSICRIVSRSRGVSFSIWSIDDFWVSCTYSSSTPAPIMPIEKCAQPKPSRVMVRK